MEKNKLQSESNSAAADEQVVKDWYKEYLNILSEVVGGEYEEDKTYTVHNTHAAIMLIKRLPGIQSHEKQIWLMKQIRKICSSDHTNKMNCCSNGMIEAVLSVLRQEKQISPDAVSHLIGLLESLGTLSITAIELKQLIGLLRLDEDEKQIAYCSRLMRAMSTMARREGKEGALHFFNIQDPTDGIHLPGIRKWPGTAFSFHTWLCLNSHIDRTAFSIPTSQHCRRIIYSFLSSSGSGFECFVSDSGELTFVVFSKKKYNRVTVPKVNLQDGHWHDVCVVHTNSKLLFAKSRLYVYVDGKQRLNSQLQYPNMSDPLTSCRVGCMVLQSTTDKSHAESHLSATSENKKTSRLMNLQKNAIKLNWNVPGVDSLLTGYQDDTVGHPIPIIGQIGSVCILHEAVTANQVKRIHTAGPNNLSVFNDENELQDLPGKMLLYYNARACKDTHIMDLSSNQNHGQLQGQKCVTWDIKDVINCIGGIQVLFPLLEQVNRFPSPPEVSASEFNSLVSLNKPSEQEDWVILPSSSYADTKLEQNQVAGFLILLRNMVQTKPVNQQTFVQTNGAAIVGALLQQVDSKLIDVNVLIAVQLLVEATASTNRIMLNHLYQNILLDFRIWSRSDFSVRKEHIHYLSTIIKDDKENFRRTFGVQYIMDVIRSHYSKEEDARTIRELLSLVKYYIVEDVTVEELTTLFNFMMACKDENMICEVLDILIYLLDGGWKQDHLYLLMFEPQIGEMLYGLLATKGFTIIYYEKILKVLYILLKTDRVNEKNKVRLRLSDCGYLGLIGLMDGFEVSGPIIKRFLEQVTVTDNLQSYNAVLAILQLIYTSGIDIKLEASRQLLSLLESKSGAAKSFAKQLGWQEALTKLFILHPISMETSDPDLIDSDIMPSPLYLKSQLFDDLGASATEDEKLCQNLLITLFTVMWKGIDGSDETAWKERGLVFAWLDHISQTNKLLCPVTELKRRLLEMMLHACTSDIKDTGHSSQSDIENAIELVHLVCHSLFRNETSVDDGQIYSKMLQENVMSLLDCLTVWDVTIEARWQEVARLGLRVNVAFVQNKQCEVEPQRQHFTDNVFIDIMAKINDFWANCLKEMRVNMQERNRERGESKLKFQSQILDIYNEKVLNEERRFQNVSTKLRNQHSETVRQWRGAKRFFTGERAAWAEREVPVVHWKLSNLENFSRMKVKLIHNYDFDIHRDASLLRDNGGLEDQDAINEIKQLLVAKEALVSKENISDDGISDEDWNVISTQNANTEEYQDKENPLLSEKCELVTLVEVINGRLEVTTTHVCFFHCSTTKDEGGEDFKWGLQQLREIHFRRYNSCRSALEMFLVDQTNYFLNFQEKVRNEVYSCILGLRPPNLIYCGLRSPAELLKSSDLTQKWVQREISNFEYLMQLNTIAGRTYNDLSQYPVFPWILCDYTSDTLDLENPAVFRDLSKPIGALNPINEQKVTEKFDNFEDPSGDVEKFHYGTHYSNAASVMHYLIRMEPFTTLHIALQSGRFDVADRQFRSVPETWNSVYNEPTDLKELIPEFFFLSEFLVNRNGFDLGKLQGTEEVVNDVILPKWALTPEDFIYKHRKALESEHVSNNLHNWIDLIFGYKQKGPAAVEALNVFQHFTYEGAVDLDAVKDPKERKALEGMINNFGQTPCQLLKDPHPQRMTFDEVVAKAMKVDKHLSIFSFLDKLKVYCVEVSPETDPVVYISVPRSQPRSIIQNGMLDTMITVSSDGILGTHGWLPYDESISNSFTFDNDPSVSNQKTRKIVNSLFAPGIEVDSKLFVVSHDCKLLISGGHWDNSLQVYHIWKGCKINHICRHIDIVTCLALDYCGSHLITGSRDTTCIVWQVQQQSGVCVNLSSKPLQTLYGHDNEVTAVHISSELDMAVSASRDGTVMIHTVHKGHYMRTLRPDQTPGYSLNIPMLAVDNMGQIVVYCHETSPIEPEEITSLHLYSINGKHICTQPVKHHIGHMIIKGDNLITGDVSGSVIVYESFGLKQLTTLPLHVPIHSLALTNGNSHLLAGLRDGKLIIIGIKSCKNLR